MEAAAHEMKTNGTVSSQVLNETSRTMNEAMEIFRFEFSELVGLDYKVIASGNKNGRRGKEFNPDNIVQKVLDLDEQVTMVSIISHELFMMENAKQFV